MKVLPLLLALSLVAPASAASTCCEPTIDPVAIESDTCCPSTACATAHLSDICRTKDTPRALVGGATSGHADVWLMAARLNQRLTEPAASPRDADENRHGPPASFHQRVSLPLRP